MGEMAEYMLNGDDCSECGEHIGSGDGFPQKCAGCRSEEFKNEDKANKPFIMQNTPGAKVALKHWLKAREWNGYSFGNNDVRGQPLIGLSWSYRPDSDWSKFDRRGLIICRDIAARDAAIEILDKASAK